MKRFFALVPMLAMWLVFTTGCVELKQSIHISRDGKMRVDYRYAVRQADFEFWQQSQAAAGQVRNDGRFGEQEHPLWPFDEKAVMEWFQQRAGLAVKDYAISRSGEKKVVEFAVECDDFDKGLSSGAFGAFSVEKDVPARGLVTIAAVQRRAGADRMSDADLRKLAGLCRGLKLELELTVPGRVEAGDGKVVSPSTVRWVIDVDKDPGVLKKLPEFKVIYRPAKP